MPASVNDKITDVRNATRPTSTTVSSSRSAGGTTLSCTSLTGWPTASKVHFVTYQIDSDSNPVAGTQLDCYGIVSGNTITNFTVVDGTDTGNSINDVVEMLPTAAWGQDLVDALMAEHNRDGTHSDITADSVSTDTISEKTPAAGVTIDSVKLKDGVIQTTGALSPVYTSNPTKFYCYPSGAIAADTTPAIIQCNTAVFDTGSNVSLTTNKGRFTAPQAGFYWFTARWEAGGGTSNQPICYLYKNGSVALRGMRAPGVAGNIVASLVTGIIQLAANDYVDARVSTGSSTAGQPGSEYCYFQGFMISAT